MFNDLWSRLRAILWRGHVERELDDELRFHLEQAVAAYEREGCSPDEARRRARLQFGGLEQVREDCRDARGLNLVDSVARDLRYAARGLLRSPGFTSVAVLSLALGIGANAAIFAVVDAFLFRPAPVKDVDRLVALADRSDKYAGYPISYPNFLDWKVRNHSFDEMAAYWNGTRVLGDDEGAERIRELDVSEGFLRVIGVAPVTGRGFLPEDHRTGAGAVALVSHELWQRRLGGDREAVGKTITLDSRPFTVIGVLPAGFNIGARADALTAIEQWGRDRESRSSHNSMYGIARLKPGVTRASARSEMDAIAAALEREHPDTNRNRRVDILTFGHVRMREASTPLFLLMGAVAFVLLIACANISNLLLSRSASRAREMAIRRAIGAGRGRLVQQLMTESLLVAMLGGVLGLLVGEGGCRVLVALTGDLAQWPGGEAIAGIHVDFRVFLFTLGVTAVAGLISGFGPALQASKGDLTPPLKEGGGTSIGAESRPIRRALVVVEVALALMLLTGAGLLIRTLHILVTDETGFEARNVLTFSLTTGVGQVPRDAETRAWLARRLEASTRQIVAEIQSLPGVTAAAVAFPLPFGHGFSGDCFHVEGRPVPAAKECPDALLRQVSPGYAAALGMHLTRGRWFAEADEEFGATVNETMAAAWWPGEDPVGMGRRFRLGTAPRFSPWYTVLGVVGNTKENGLDTERLPEIYVRRYGGRDILVRTAGDPVAVAAAIRRRIHSIDPGRAMFDVQPLETLIVESVRNRRALTWLLGIFAGIALALAAVGIYGVVSYSVARRTGEMGLRMALGARPGDVMALVLAQAMTPVIWGLALGGAASYLTARALAGFLFGIPPTDPVTFAAVVVLFGAIAFVACLIPARRATRVNPVVALRCE